MKYFIFILIFISCHLHASSLLYTPLKGKAKGHFFSQYIYNPTFKTSSIAINQDFQIYSIKLEQSNQKESHWTKLAGRRQGYQTIWKVPNDSYIKSVEIGINKKGIKSLVFYTDKHIASPYFGGVASSIVTQVFPDGYQLVGVYGRADRQINQLGFILAKSNKI